MRETTRSFEVNKWNRFKALAEEEEEEDMTRQLVDIMTVIETAKEKSAKLSWADWGWGR